ncbi:MAG: hypothetical protein R3C30_02375 [Hyphomonadaceae bacterium]
MSTSMNSPGVSIVQKLLGDIADPSVTVSATLRTAKIIATKLGQADALVWINNELNGYSENMSADDLPSYRRLSGTWRAFDQHYGWQTIHFPDPERERMFSQCPIGASLPNIEHGFKSKDDGGFAFHLTPEKKALMCKAIGRQTDVQLDLDSASLHEIIDAVRGLLLDWALELEKAGVSGIDMDFTAREKKDAAVVTQHVFAQNAIVIGSMDGNASVNANQTATATLDIGAINAMVQQARACLGSLPEKQREAVEPVLNEIEVEAAKPKPDRGLLRNLLTSARTKARRAISPRPASSA